MTGVVSGSVSEVRSEGETEGASESDGRPLVLLLLAGLFVFPSGVCQGWLQEGEGRVSGGRNRQGMKRTTRKGNKRKTREEQGR